MQMREASSGTPRAKGLDKLSHTFTRDQEFCDALAARCPERVGRLFVYLRWAHNYMPSIQEELHGMVGRHFAADHRQDAGFWTHSLTGGVFKDLGLVPYLVVRGLIWDAGFALRRSLENAGVLAHLWQDPGKAEYLASPDTGPFRNAFVAESDSGKAAALRSRGVQKRFAACSLGKPMSDLYRMLSAYAVHGGTPNQLVTSELLPNSASCMLLNRPDPLRRDVSRDLDILADGCEMLCVETVFVHGTFGNKYGILPSKGGEGGAYLTKLLDRGPDSEMTHLVQATLHDFGWASREAQ